MKNEAKFFDYAFRRHQIYLDRAAGKPKPWTKDKALQQYSFTNVYRELDKTTQWYAQHVREIYKDQMTIVLATALFRMFNRISVGEALFSQLVLGRNQTVFEVYCTTYDIKMLETSIKQFCGTGPYVTGAYIITSPKGYTKLRGILQIINHFNRNINWPKMYQDALKNHWTLEKAWNWFKEVPYFGGFHSYEIVTDLRHTPMLCNAADINLWANIGPGCRRGLNRIFGRDAHDHSKRDKELLLELRYLLGLSRDKTYWPNTKEFPAWEMREVEHTCCEFDKWMRVRNGEGRPRSTFDGA